MGTLDATGSSRHKHCCSLGHSVGVPPAAPWKHCAAPSQGTAHSTLHSDELKALSRQPSRRRASGPAWRTQAKGWGRGPPARLGHVTPQTSSRFSREHPFPTAPATLLGELLRTHVALNLL